MDRLRAFEVFATVVARGSFVGAAEALNTSPANVTRYVAELEGYFGARLLNRTSRTLSLTQSGEDFYGRCRAILDERSSRAGACVSTRRSASASCIWRRSGRSFYSNIRT